MPRKDPAERYAYQNAWRKQAIKNGYGKWLWNKRKCMNDDREEFRQALEQISDIGDRSAVLIAQKALRRSDRRWKAIGPPETHVAGGKTVFDPGPDAGDSLIQALDKLGLSQYP